MSDVLNLLIVFLLGVLVGGLWMRSLALDTITELARDPKFWALIKDVWDKKDGEK